jgi:excisionase family DNA binding protein
LPLGGIRLVCPKQIARALGVHERTVQRMFRAGELEGFRTGAGGGPWRTTAAEVEAYIARELTRERERCRPRPREGKRSVAVVRAA